MAGKRFNLIVIAMMGAVATVAAACGSSGSANSSSGSHSAASSAPSSPAAVVVDGASITADSQLNATLPDNIRSSGVASVASAYPYPPWEYTQGGQLVGVEADLARALGAKLGVEFKFHNVKFDGLVPGVVAGNYDLLISAIHDTPDRRNVLTFVDEMAVGSGFLVKKGNPEHIQGLSTVCGKTVVVQASSAQVGYVQDYQSKCTSAGKGKIKTMTLPDAPSSVLAVTTGKASAYFSDKIALQYIADTTNQGNSVEVVSDTAKGIGVSPVGIGVKKGNDQLVSAVKGALQALIQDGSYSTILNKYNFGFAALSSAQVNGGTG